MGKSTNGPEMQDILTYLHQMDKQNNTTTTILVIPDGTVIAPSCTISLLSVLNGELPTVSVEVRTTVVRYPHRDSKTFEGALYRAVIEHDKHVSARQQQSAPF